MWQQCVAASRMMGGPKFPPSADSRARLDRLQSDFDDRVLRLRILDPAMGSGHFLLRACSYLAEEIATHPYTGEDAVRDTPGDSAVVYWKRKVAETCIFGVDQNPLAVELAKLALWLETVAVDQPLTFLNHHLRVGNSLLGPTIDDLGKIPGQGDLHVAVFDGYVQSSLPQLLGKLREIRTTSSGHEKGDRYN